MFFYYFFQLKGKQIPEKRKTHKKSKFAGPLLVSFHAIFQHLLLIHQLFQSLHKPLDADVDLSEAIRHLLEELIIILFGNKHFESTEINIAEKTSGNKKK